MAWSMGTRVKRAWDAFRKNRDPTVPDTPEGYIRYGATSSRRPDRIVYTQGNERTIIASIITRIANDVASNNIRHVKLDDRERYSETVLDDLNNCLSTEANIDQTGRALIHDAVASMLDEGCVAIAPLTTDVDPAFTDSYKIYELRVGKIVEWRPESVKIDVYNENTGRHEQIWVGKRYTAIIENPFYSVMNQPNSTFRRLTRKLALLDKIDMDVGSNKFDIIIQLPYLTKAEAKKKQASERRQEIEDQLNGSRLGVAYIDAAERVIQLNRPLENTLLGQIEYLTKQCMSELGITQEILDGTADEKVMNNYNHRIVEVVLLALTEEMERKFLSKTARSQRHAIRFFSDPLRNIPASEIPDVADKLTRNEIVTSNEIRQVIGLKPSTDPDADELRNKNLNKSENELQQEAGGPAPNSPKDMVKGFLRQMDGKSSKIQNGEESK